MAVGPVYWGSYAGETLEKVMAVLVSQENPGAIRRTPSSGDGGVDILIDADGGWQVRQIKGFVGRMTANRRQQVKASFEEVKENPRLRRPITRWTLTVPIDPTSAEQRWFEELTADAPFHCNWDGEVFWHGIAASHPHVIDYYLRDGRERVEGRSQALLAAARAPSGALSALDVAGHLEVLRELLNREDPHYRYEFSTGRAPLEPAVLPEGTVLALSRSLDDGQFLTTFVVERYGYAASDAPIGGQFSVRLRDAERDIDISEEFQDFRTFGVGVELPEGTLDLRLSAPAGLGGTFEGGGGRLGPALVHEAPTRTRLRVVHPEDGELAELGLETVSVTAGELGGVEFSATDRAAILNVRFRLWPKEDGSPDKLTFDTTLSDIGGQPVEEVLAVAQLLARFASPHELHWLEEYGSRSLAVHRFVDDAALVSEELFAFIANLSVVQGHVRGTVLLPHSIDEQTARTVAEVAHLFRHGELHGKWTDIEMQLKEGVTPGDIKSLIGDQGALLLETSWVLELEGQRYDLGPMHQVAAMARLADEQPEGGKSVRLVPGDDNSLVQRLGPLPRT